MKRLLLLTVSFLFIIMGLIRAQEDSTKTDDGWKWHWKWSDWSDWADRHNWDIDFGFKNSSPAISLQYGIAKLDRKNFQNKFVDPNLVEVKLGYIKEHDAWETNYIIEHRYKYFYLSNESNNLASKKPSGIEIESDMWRFGFGKSSGYGYKLAENTSLIFYNSTSLNWSRIDFKYPNILTLLPDPEIDLLNLYDESFRFGTSSEGGIRFRVVKNFMIDAGYERSIVFQRHLFWKWAGSAIIEEAAQGLLDGFIYRIFKSTPDAGPIVNFVLKNALSYGIYELRKDKMNWPFKSESPIVYDQFKFGVTFVF